MTMWLRFINKRIDSSLFMPEDIKSNENSNKKEFQELKLFVSDEMYRAFQRCVWILVQETGRERKEIMEEAVHDFLVKHGC